MAHAIRYENLNCQFCNQNFSFWRKVLANVWLGVNVYQIFSTKQNIVICNVKSLKYWIIFAWLLYFNWLVLCYISLSFVGFFFLFSSFPLSCPVLCPVWSFSEEPNWACLSFSAQRPRASSATCSSATLPTGWVSSTPLTHMLSNGSLSSIVLLKINLYSVVLSLKFSHSCQILFAQVLVQMGWRK